MFGKKRFTKGMIMVFLAVVMVFAGTGCGADTSQTATDADLSVQSQSNYEEAVECILQEDYQRASELLEESEEKDSKALLTYANLQLSLDEYKGDAEGILTQMEAVDVIENEDVSDQYDKACVEIASVGDIQKEIDQIDNETYSEDSAEQVNTITKEIDEIPERYQVLLETEKYDQAVETITNVEEETPVGVAILAINDLDEITLDSEGQIERARIEYNELSEEEQGEVVNYGELTEAESGLQVLKEEKAAKEKAKKKKAAAKKKKEEAERKKREEEERRAAEEQDITVHITKSGDKYHSAGCYYLKSDIEISLEDAKARGYEPCSRCHPPT